MPPPVPPQPCTLVWFRDELRLADNRAWARAVTLGRPIIAVYIDETPDTRLRPIGGAARWWLHHSLVSLQQALSAAGVQLLFFKGHADVLIPRLAADCHAGAVLWSRRYGKAERTLDADVKSRLVDKGHAAESFNDRLLYEPWEVKPQSGDNFKVFTPFWKAATRTAPAPPLAAPNLRQPTKANLPKKLGAVSLDDLGLLPRNPDWAAGLRAAWVPGEASARHALDQFVGQYLAGYAGRRDRPDLAATSSLSPHLRFGEISVRQCWQTVHRATAMDQAPESDVAKFLSELGWREFSYHLLYHQRDLATTCVQPRFESFEWLQQSPHLAAWQHGKTGYPLVDAGMRQLWQSGWMHNRVRMIAASFLVKHLLVDWRIGEAWFWDTLVDADPASNPASWQWVAGCGADAAPYFRIFNPVLQSERFDAEGNYIKRWVRELAKLDASDIHKPWEHVQAIRKTEYPEPVVDLATGRDRALAALAALPRA